MIYLTLHAKQVFGRVLNYPACQVSRDLAELLGKKTFSRENIEMLKVIGFRIEWTKEEDV